MRAGIRRTRALGGLALGVAAAALPQVAAAEEGSRALGSPADTGRVVLLTFLGIGAVMFVSGLGYLYRRQRGIHWDYQLQEGSLSEGDRSDGAAH